MKGGLHIIIIPTKIKKIMVGVVVNSENRYLPANTKTKFNRSTLNIGSLMNSRAKKTVNIGEVAEIMVASAIGKCLKQYLKFFNCTSMVF